MAPSNDDGVEFGSNIRFVSSLTLEEEDDGINYIEDLQYVEPHAAEAPMPDGLKSPLHCLITLR